MKRILYFIFILTSINSSAQPNFVGALQYSAPENGGAIYKFQTLSGTFTNLHSFNNLAPHLPITGVTLGTDGWLYGELLYNGTDNKGAFYKINQDGSSFTVLRNLQDGSSTRPYQHTDGFIYFTDGSDIVQYDPIGGTFQNFHSDDGVVARNLYIDNLDWIYFPTFNGISKMKSDGTGWTPLKTFTQTTDGINAVAGLTEIPGDTLFGVNTYGGTFDNGTLFSLKKDGTLFTVHHQFELTTGAYPESQLVFFNGKLYGTTSQGGAQGYGVLYSIKVDGTGYTVLASFDRDSPRGEIVIASNGRVIGSYSQFTTIGGVPYRFFKVDTTGENMLGLVVVNQRENGHATMSPFLVSNDETIYYVTSTMGRHDGGALNITDTSGFGSSLFHFGASINGFKPGALTKGTDGKLYGYTVFGGPDGNGTIYKIQDDGNQYTKLHMFIDAEGYNPIGKLLEASDGKLYGMLETGGPSNTGAIYRIDKDGSNFGILYNFSAFANGYSPAGSLVEDSNGFLYGATSLAFPGNGVVFRIQKDGSNYTVLKNFDGTDLRWPNGVALYRGFLYGTALQDPSANGGIFRIKTDGSAYQVLHTFSGAVDGSSPQGLPIIANGKVYGTTAFGGNNYGVVYSLDTLGNNFTVIKNFVGGNDGGYPSTSLTLSADGKLYGTGFSDAGSILYSLNTSGTNYSILKTFNLETEGQVPTSLLDLAASSSLPVKLTKFQVEKRNGTALISWETSQEQNSKLFEIERSGNGISFNRIGSVNARGNSNTPTSYSFSDDVPVNGVNYYRLKQIDNDGKITYSVVRSVAFNKVSNLIVYPNPAREKIELRLPSVYADATVEVINGEGRILKKFNIANINLVRLNVGSYPAGNYLIRVTTNSKSEIVSFIKMEK